MNVGGPIHQQIGDARLRLRFVEPPKFVICGLHLKALTKGSIAKLGKGIHAFTSFGFHSEIIHTDRSSSKKGIFCFLGWPTAWERQEQKDCLVMCCPWERVVATPVPTPHLY